MCAFSLKDVTARLGTTVGCACACVLFSVGYYSAAGSFFAFTLSVAADLQSSFGLLKGCFPFAICYWKEVLLT